MKSGNENKKPQWLKNKEQVSAAIGRSTAPELLLCGLTFPTSQKILEDPNVWIGNTAATTHSTPHTQGLYDMKKSTAKDSVRMGNGKSESASSIGKLTGTLCNRHGDKLIQSTMQAVTHLPTGKLNLFSLTKIQKNGWLLHGNNKAIWLTKGDDKITFDIIIPTPEGMVFAVYFNRNEEIASMSVNATGPTEAAPVTMSIEQAHTKFGHTNEEDTRKTAKELGIVLTQGTLRPCEACTVAKAKQKNVIKRSAHKAATKTDERRIFIDICSTVKKTKKRKDLACPNWYLTVDEQTQLKFSKFCPKKNDMIEPACAQLQK
jgi:hypothetical protein